MSIILDKIPEAQLAGARGGHLPAFYWELKKSDLILEMNALIVFIYGLKLSFKMLL